MTTHSTAVRPGQGWPPIGRVIRVGKARCWNNVPVLSDSCHIPVDSSLALNDPPTPNLNHLRISASMYFHGTKNPIRFGDPIFCSQDGGHSWRQPSWKEENRAPLQPGADSLLFTSRTSGAASCIYNDSTTCVRARLQMHAFTGTHSCASR